MKILKSKISVIFLLVSLISVFATGVYADNEAPVFGPVTALRAKGKPAELTYNFPKLPGFEAPFRLIVINGDSVGKARISSAFIYLNGSVVLSPSDLNQNVGEITKEVDLREFNTLTIKLQSKPESFLKVSVVGQKIDLPEQVFDQSSVMIGPGGGTGTLENFATVKLGEDPLRPNLTLTLQKFVSAHKMALYQGETMGAGPAHSELLRITSSEILNHSVGVVIQVPRVFVSSLPQGYEVELFAEFTQHGADGEVIATFEALGTSYDPVRSIAYANLPKYAFTWTNSVTTSIIVGSYQKAPTTQITGTNTVPSQDVHAAPNDVVPLSADLSFSIPPQIGNPLHAAMNVTSNFGPRSHPVTGEWTFHSGVDLGTNSQPVYPVMEGTVTASGPQTPCTLVNGICMTGFGHRVRIAHEDGYTSVYAHLQPQGLPAIGTQVTTNTRIGTSDTTGTATGDHLHLEYRIDRYRVDPMLFIGQQDANGYLDDLSVIALVNGDAIEVTRREVSGTQVTNNLALFQYQAQLDLVPLQLSVGSTNQLSIVVQNANGTSVNIANIPLIINPLALRVMLRWDKYDTDVDLHVRDSLGNESWYGNLCGIPNGCLDRDDVDGFGPEVFDLTQMANGVSYTVFLHYYSDHGNGPTTATVVVEQDTQTFGPFSYTLSDGQLATVGVYPQ